METYDFRMFYFHEIKLGHSDAQVARNVGHVFGEGSSNGFLDFFERYDARESTSCMASNINLRRRFFQMAFFSDR